MGNEKIASGKRVFDDTYKFPQDSQDLADDIFENANVRVGTSAARQALPVAQQRVGMLWVESDTGLIFENRAANQWVRVAGPSLVAGGVVSAGTNGSGVVQVTHGMTRKPVAVTVTMSTTGPAIPSRLKAMVGTIGDTVFDVQVLRSDSNDAPLVSNPVVFYWMAVS